MGGLSATIKHNPEMGNIFPHVLIQFHHSAWARRGKRTSREKYGVATFRKGIIGIAARRSSRFVAKDWRVFRIGSAPLPDHFPAHCQEHPAWFYSGRTYRGAKPTKTAFKSDVLLFPVGGIVCVGDGFWIAVPAQERALLLTQAAFNAFFKDLFSPIHQFLS